ncbi:alpha-mannosidase [compost metagenome]
MTLFRAVKNIICTEWRSAGVFPNQEGGQLQQKLVYNYAICPMNSSWENSDLSVMADCFNIPLKPVQTCVPAMEVVKPAGMLPAKHSFYQVTGKLSVSCIKKAEDSNSIIVRLFNPYPTEQSGSIILGCDVQNVCMTNLNEEEEAASNLTMIDNAVELKIKPNKIVTLKLDLA